MRETNAEERRLAAQAEERRIAAQAEERRIATEAEAEEQRIAGQAEGRRIVEANRFLAITLQPNLIIWAILYVTSILSSKLRLR